MYYISFNCIYASTDFVKLDLASEEKKVVNNSNIIAWAAVGVDFIQYNSTDYRSPSYRLTLLFISFRGCLLTTQYLK